MKDKCPPHSCYVATPGRQLEPRTWGKILYDFLSHPMLLMSFRHIYVLSKLVKNKPVHQDARGSTRYKLGTRTMYQTWLRITTGERIIL